MLTAKFLMTTVLQSFLLRIERLSLQKEQIISDLEKIKDEAEEMRERTNGIEYQLDELTRKQNVLMRRVERIVYRVESKSPFLSEAEECMMKELEGLEKHMKTMLQKLTEVKVNVAALKMTRVQTLSSYCLATA